MSLNQLSEVRARIADAKSEIEAVSLQRRSRKDAAAHMVASVAVWSAKAEHMARINTARMAAGDVVTYLTVNARVAGPQGTTAVTIDLGPIAVLLLGAQAVQDALSAHVAGVPEGLTEKARSKKLADLAALLHKAQFEEEGLIRELEAAGESIVYRGDADPSYALTWRNKK